MKTWMPRQEVHYRIYLWSLALFVCCLPLSRYLLSISQFLLLFNWLAEGRLKEKRAALQKDFPLLIFMSILAVYLAGLFYSADLPAAFIKVKNVLPLVVLPVVVTTSRRISTRDLYRILLLFCVAVAVAAWICLIAYYHSPSSATRDFRKISLFIPHIRFALLIVMAIGILLYTVFFNPVPMRFSVKAFLLILFVFLADFLFLLRSFAGILLLALILALFALQLSAMIKKQAVRISLHSVLVLSFALGTLWVVRVDQRNFKAPVINPSLLEKRTLNGRAYEHDLMDKTMENGNYVNLYVCEPELRKEWNSVSRIPYDGKDLKQQDLRYTLRRYMTSKGLRKDSAAMEQLTDADIRAIEAGRANYLFHERPGLQQRLYETLWEIHMWQNSGFVQSHSFGQRLVFLKTAREIIHEHFWTGVGTGDVYAAMLETTRKNHNEIEARWKGEPHNEYAFLLMAFGIFGFSIVVFSWIYPVVIYRSYRSFLFIIFALLMIISMMVLDTIESYDNMAFFAFFYTMLVFEQRAAPANS